MTTTSETLNRAADLIEERGWTEGVEGWPTEKAPDGPLCLEGGIIAALGMSFEDDPLQAFEDCGAYRAVQSYVGYSADRDEADMLVEPLWRFNDSHTATEVIEVLRAVAVIEAAREDESAAADPTLATAAAR